MPKATFEFTLPEENEEYRLYNNATNLYSALFEIKQYLRTELKYKSENRTEMEEKILEDLSDKVWEALRDNHVSELF